MWELIAVLAAGGVHMGWMAEPPAKPVSTVAELSVGEMVHVEDVNGRRATGAIADVSGMTLTIVEDEVSVTMPAAGVQTVRRQDSLANGAMLGVAGGLLGGVLGARNVCGDEAVKCAVLLALGAGPGAGAAAGAMLDARMHATLYRRSDGLQVSVAPVLSSRPTGARLSIGW